MRRRARRPSPRALIFGGVALVLLLRVGREFEGMVRSSSLASSLRPPRALGCAVDDATFLNEAAKVAPSHGGAAPTCGRIAALATYWVDAPRVAGAAPLFSTRIVDATADNHRAAARARNVRYVRGTRGHPRCGKMRFVRETLATLQEGEWLLFLDADAALSACRRDAWGTFASAACQPRAEYAAPGHRLLDPTSLLAGSKFGVFLVRNDAWARDYLRRFASALEARPLLCATSTFPENAAAAVVTTEADRCHYARVSSLLDVAPHLVSVEAKRDPAKVARFVDAVRNETRCWARRRRVPDGFRA